MIWIFSFLICGLQTEAKDTPKRIITVAPNSAEIICALDACDRIIGVSQYCVYPPELKSRTRVGGFVDASLERFIGLRPDLIVLRGRNESIEQLCRQRGIRLFLDETDTLQGIEETVEVLGRMLDRADRAAALTRDFRSKLDAIRARVSGRPRPRVLVIIARQPDRLANLLSAGRGTFLDEMIEVAGGANVFGHLDMRYPQISLEAIISARPDVILELMPERNLSNEAVATLRRQWRQLGRLPAVESDRIHVLTDDHCMIPSLRYVDIIEKVSKLLHPDNP